MACSLLLNSIYSSGYITVCLSIHIIIDIWIVPTFMYKPMYGNRVLFDLDRYLENWLGMVGRYVFYVLSF